MQRRWLTLDVWVTAKQKRKACESERKVEAKTMVLIALLISTMSRLWCDRAAFKSWSYCPLPTPPDHYSSEKTAPFSGRTWGNFQSGGVTLFFFLSLGFNEAVWRAGTVNRRSWLIMVRRQGCHPPTSPGFKSDPADHHHRRLFLKRRKAENCSRPPWQPVTTHWGLRGFEFSHLLPTLVASSLPPFYYPPCCHISVWKKKL